MSQEGIVDIEKAYPQIPTRFVADSGIAIPIANTLEILGTSVVAGTTPVDTTASGNTVTVQVQLASAVAATDATKVGLANFDSAAFSVDANGFVTLAATGLHVDSIGTQTGTNPVLPTAGGLVTINGSSVAAGTNPVRSNGTGANTLALEVQTAQALAASDATKIGLANFNSTAFTVDANGFVSLFNAGPFVESVSGTSDRITSTGGVTPVIDIAATYVGQTSITTLGTVGTGEWQGTTVGIGFGGTGLATTPTNGQLLIGNGTNYTLAALTAGSGVSITNGSGSITVASTGGGIAWTDVTGTTQTIAASNGYLSNNAGTVTFTLPASGTIGDVFRIAGVQGAWTIAQAAGQQIRFGSAATTVGVGGSLSSTNAGDCIECVATNTSASTVWRMISSIGNITIV